MGTKLKAARGSFQFLPLSHPAEAMCKQELTVSCFISVQKALRTLLLTYAARLPYRELSNKFAKRGYIEASPMPNEFQIADFELRIVIG